MTVTIEDAAAEMRRLSQLLDDALGYLARQVDEYAEAESAYRKQRSLAWAQTTGTAKEREDAVNAMTAEFRKRRDLADGMRQVGLESIRSRRVQISAWQSLLARDRAEAEFSRTGPLSDAA